MDAMDDVVQFVEARLAEQEAAAPEATDPDFILGEVAAMRELLAIWAVTRDESDRPHPLSARLPEILAGIWSHHPDYQQVWRSL